MNPEEQNQNTEEAQNDQEQQPEESNQQDQEYQQPEMPQIYDNKFRLVKLFDLFLSLKKYIEIFLQTYETVEPDMLNEFQYKIIVKNNEDTKNMLNDLQFYIDNVFKTKDYKQNLYSYMLYNKQFALSISKIRNTLNIKSDSGNE